MLRISALPVFVLLAGSALAAATGRIVGPDGAPVAGANVCEQLIGSPEHCVSTGADGVYRMDSPLRATLIVRASGFVAKVIDAAPLTAPVTLQRAASFIVGGACFAWPPDHAPDFALPTRVIEGGLNCESTSAITLVTANTFAI